MSIPSKAQEWPKTRSEAFKKDDKYFLITYLSFRSPLVIDGQTYHYGLEISTYYSSTGDAETLTFPFRGSLSLIEISKFSTKHEPSEALRNHIDTVEQLVELYRSSLKRRKKTSQTAEAKHL